MSGAARPADWRTWVKRLAPWLIAGTAIAVVLHKYSPRLIADELAKGEVLAVAPFIFGFMLVSLGIVALADSIVIRGCTGKPRYRDVIVGKGGASLLAMLGYAAGHGAYGLWIARKTGTRAAITSGIVVYIISSELVGVSIVATASVWLFGAEVPARLRIAAPAIVAVLVLLKLIGPLNVIRSDAVWVEPWRRVGALQTLTQLALRVLQVYLMVLAVWASARAFGMPIPLPVMAAYLPIILVVGSLPVNVLGFGAVQGTWLLLAPWSSGEKVLAFSLVIQLMMLLSGLARGLPFVRRVVADIGAADAA